MIQEHTHQYSPRIQQALASLSPAARSAALRQLPFARDSLELQTAITADAFILATRGFSEDKISKKLRDAVWRERLDARRAGWATDAAELVEQDEPSAALQRTQDDSALAAECRALGLEAAAPAATVRQEPAMPVPGVAARCHRSARCVQASMRRLFCAELAGQRVLPGIPPALAVYRPRALGALGVSHV